MSELPISAPSRRRGRPPKISEPLQTSGTTEQAIQSDPQIATAPPIPPDDSVDLRERGPQPSGSDSTVHGASDSYLPVEAGPVLQPNPVLPEHLPSPPATPPAEQGWVPILSNDVVQIINNENKLFGTLFTVGDVRSRKVHGYQIMPGGKIEYITANEDECFRIGTSKIRSRNSCSNKWMAENR